MGRTPTGETREKIFVFMRDRLLSGRPPTVREIRDAFGFSATQTVHAHLRALVAQGRLEQDRTSDKGRSRGYRLSSRPGENGQVRLVPLLGRVQAGALTEAIEEPEGYLTVRTRRSSDELFGLRVRGESMVGAGILPGDVVVVRKQASADSGDIVVAMVEDEATVKRLSRAGGKILLLPENPEFAPIEPPLGALLLLGKVIEVRRFLEGGSRDSRLTSEAW